MSDADVDSLLARARGLGLLTSAPVSFGRGPGRLDVMGGIADYSGSLVLQLPLPRAAHVAVAARADRRLCVASLPDGDRHDSPHTVRRHELSLDAFLAAVGQGYAACRALCAPAPWSAYLLGVLAVLLREHGAQLRTGLDLALASEVPEAKGMSSSAAVEVATARALASHLGLALAPRDLALACQRAENQVVGAACGVMDQMASACGEPGKLLRLLCQPAELQGHVAIPKGFAFVALDSGVRHAVTGADYTSVRVGAFMGWRILAELCGLEVTVRDDVAEFVHPQWGRALANVPPSAWRGLAEQVPLSLSGREFLARYRATSDATTVVDPARSYAVRVPTAHPIEEHHRVRTFAALLPHAAEPGMAELLGELMYQSHASYSACGLGHPATDALVDAVRRAGPARGCFGAKITGGGSGGTVAALVGQGADLPRELARHLLTT